MLRVATRYQTVPVHRRFLQTVHKELLFADTARRQLLVGASVLTRAVACTLGPKGRNVLIEKKYGFPAITKDGVSVAKEVVLSNRFENMGALLLKDVANKANMASGDGTTTATVLAYGVLKESIKHISCGAHPGELRRGVQLATKHVVAFLERNARAVTTGADIKHVATVSANGDEHLGGLIALALEAVGTDGLVTIEKGKLVKDSLHLSTGYEFNRGFLPQFVRHDQKSGTITLTNAVVVFADCVLSNAQDVLPSLAYAKRQQRPLLVIANLLEGDALAACVTNRLKGQVEVLAVKSPGFGDHRAESLRDLTSILGGEVFTLELGVKPSSASKRFFGTAPSVTLTANNTIITLGAEKTATGAEDVENPRVTLLRTQVADPSLDDHNRKQYQQRLAKLTTGIAVIKVGGTSQLEVGEKKDRLDDALNATKSAIEFGIIPGGGLALVKALADLEASLDVNALTFNERLGVEVIQTAIQLPARWILANAGLNAPCIVSKLREDTAWAHGFDVVTEAYGDMYALGVVDSLKSVRAGLTEAAGVSSLIGTSEVVISQVQENKVGITRTD